MIRINRKLEYAVIALKHMKDKVPGQLTTAKEISERYHTPFDATARVLQLMTQKNILKSEQGVQGGYLIVKDLKKISLHELIEFIVGRVEVASCISGDRTCEIEASCNIKSPVHFLNTRLMEFYRGISIADLLNTHAGKASDSTALVAESLR